MRVAVEMSDSHRNGWSDYLRDTERNRDAVASLGIVRSADAARRPQRAEPRPAPPRDRLRSRDRIARTCCAPSCNCFAWPPSPPRADSRPATSASPRRGSLPRWACWPGSTTSRSRWASSSGTPPRSVASPRHCMPSSRACSPRPARRSAPTHRVPMMPQPDDADGHPPTAAPPRCPPFRPTAWCSGRTSSPPSAAAPAPSAAQQPSVPPSAQ